jgi:hypothetical protein
VLIVNDKFEILQEKEFDKDTNIAVVEVNLNKDEEYYIV